MGEPEPITVNSCDADSRGTGSKTATLASLQSGPQTDAVKRDGSNVERPVRSRTELEEVLRPGKDGLILADLVAAAPHSCHKCGMSCPIRTISSLICSPKPVSARPTTGTMAKSTVNATR